MDAKKLFGVLLTLLGTVGLIYAGYGFVKQTLHWRELLVTASIGLVFFGSGIALLKTTSDTP
ncbi:hypothetical protein SAMN05660909_01736 [Chitinophaga terrae (ex Kim and Jung 2007)]|jgi:hypothetical protein|uniref:Uncharacterized protein n=1 Tax=Chitinophaga terrae (ex Kim and Jung 2007) TaxID=408074 RepID=A0A1H4ARX8_9BACT|nr:hypothetical protein [Chitinophaga terrae (ex Kim and Jung 2007)]GEP89174.1 hypothetical protein CTE07_08190 [Chitinophaga terrae (ex Kim and Jung 2007)]SEA38616.1 hypothetical protein SAMN05660909_01736 [Chitinophaga terrae (ex Kim and Jung 2007)]